ncbi:hypothetical protein ACIRLA_46500 [Streptomyces sp. NPDC102364]|jgi:hypothetical protein|uniref:hypothetical protein n=1 Tax=Streptomyces sp. NPDC102364 TaxID=3366161 RepID=UPI00381F5015
MPADKTPIVLADDGRDPWERQPRESEAMHSRYLGYQALGRTRTVRRVAEKWGKSPAYLHHIAWRYHWRERAHAFDEEQDRLFMEQLAAERRRMVDDHLKLSRGMLAKVARRLQTLDPDELTPADLNRWATTLTQIQSRVLGEPTQTVALQGGTAGAPPIEIGAVTGGPDAQRARFDVLRERVMGALSAGTLAELDPADLDPDDVEGEEL